MTISLKLHTRCLGRGCHVNPRKEISLVSCVICDPLVTNAWSNTRSVSDARGGRAESQALASPASGCPTGGKEGEGRSEEREQRVPVASQIQPVPEG